MKRIFKLWLKLVTLGGLTITVFEFVINRKYLGKDRESLLTYAVIAPLMFLVGCLMAALYPIFFVLDQLDKIRGKNPGTEVEQDQEGGYKQGEWVNSLKAGDPVLFNGGRGYYELRAVATVRKIKSGRVWIRIEEIVQIGERSKYRKRNCIWADPTELSPAS